MPRTSRGFRFRPRLVVSLLSLLLLSFGTGEAERPRDLWFYYSADLSRDDALTQLEPVWRRAAAAGYTKVMLVDSKLARLSEQNASYFATLELVKSLAHTLGLEIVPGVFWIGRSHPLLARSPDLAEGLPVRGTRFVVRGGIAHLSADPPVALGTRPSRIEPAVLVTGRSATISKHGGTARFGFRVPVSPWRCYHVAVRVRTRDYTGEPSIRVIGSRRRLDWSRIRVKNDQDWKVVHAVFNSLGNRTIEVQFGDWYPGEGKLEWRDWAIEEVGPLNLLRRADTPFTIEGRREGRDFEAVRDTLLGMRPWRGQYDSWHTPPAIRTALPDGTVLRASWYHAAVINEEQVTACLSEPRTLHLLRDEARSVRNALGTRGFAMLHDEIRALGWDPACVARKTTPGAILAEHVRQCARLLRGAELYVWGDMFDPHQNAVRDDYLVNGSLAGSWTGLPSEVTILNWNAEDMRTSLRFFAARGHKQVICGYYDGPPNGIRWLVRDARGIRGVTGVMYTTWRNDYSQLEAFAHAARDEK